MCTMSAVYDPSLSALCQQHRWTVVGAALSVPAVPHQTSVDRLPSTTLCKTVLGAVLCFLLPPQTRPSLDCTGLFTLAVAWLFTLAVAWLFTLAVSGLFTLAVSGLFTLAVSGLFTLAVSASAVFAVMPWNGKSTCPHYNINKNKCPQYNYV